MISVIVPVHNTAAYLQECIDSILTQTDILLELILVDDASTDSSTEICRRAAACHSGRVRYIREDGVGVSQARNRGLKEALGKYISFVDSDDMLLPGALESLQRALRENDDCDIAVGQFTQDMRSTSLQGPTATYSAEEAIIRTLYRDRAFHESAWAKLYNKNIFARGNVFEAGRRYEDLEACPRFYSRAHRIAVTDSTVYFYRPNPSSFINNWTDDRLDALWATERIQNFVEQHFPKAIPAARNRRFSSLFNIFNLCVSTMKRPGYDRALLDGTADRCWQEIEALRAAIIRDSRVMPKNRLAALISYAGQPFMRRLSGVVMH
ncbi:MAG: glycosyltransferase [Muribaculaceae bacterium]|nr:glycosyltransferase [Muribaculaceae bacterium]